MEFGFLLLGGMILIMGVFAKVKALKEANKALLALKIPIGIVVFLTGLASFKGGGRFVFPALMGIIAGIFLILDLFKLIPEAEESVKKAEITLTVFQIPVGVIAVIAAIYGLFVS